MIADGRNVSRHVDIVKAVAQLREEIERADAVVAGAGAGLSASAGFQYSGERFYEHFQDFADKYGFQDMYTGGFYPYKTLEEYWAYWSRYILLNRYQDAPRPVYRQLMEVLREKDYFVLTTNVDHCFQKAGIDKRRLFYTQGDYGLFQCSKPCHDKTYDNEAIIREMAARQENMRVPSELIPYCPVCGASMSMNLRADASFVEDAGWHLASDRYASFLKEHKSKRVLFLELGVGYNTPGIIKFSFWKMAAQWPDVAYACINQGEAYVPEEMAGRSICIDGDIGEILSRLREKK